MTPITDANNSLQQYVSQHGAVLPSELLHLIANVDWAIRNTPDPRTVRGMVIGADFSGDDRTVLWVAVPSDTQVRAETILIMPEAVLGATINVDLT